MPPSTRAADTHAARRIIVLPPAGREEQLARWGIEDTSRRVALRENQGSGDYWNEDGGCAPHQGAASRTGLAPEDVEYLRGGGWSVATLEGGGRDGGLTSHRGVLRGDEYIDYEKLVAMVERELGFTLDEIHSVYRQGPLSADQRELRGRIDARLLALSRSGANMIALAPVFGWTVKAASNGGGASCDTMERALARARTPEKAVAA